MKDLRVALRVLAQDLGSKDIKRVIGSVDKAVQQSGQAQQRVAAISQRSVRREVSQTARTEQATTRTRITDNDRAGRVILNNTRRMEQARERLGVKSERALQNEIARTAIAYKRLEQSGKLSGRELARAAEAAQKRIQRLQAEMGKLDAKPGGGWGKGLAAVGAGAMAGAAVAMPKLSQTMDYSRQIALISNTAYAERDQAGRQAGQDEIKAAISQAVKAGGGTREQAADALYSLLGDGGLGREDAYSLLPTLQKMGLATGKSSSELVPLVGALRAQGIDNQALPDALGKILHSSETGGFGLDSMIASLPQVLQAQKDLGMSGMAGLDTALANMQGITQETGQPGQAASSTVALLQALRNPAVAKQVEDKLSISGKRVDLAATLAKGVTQDVDPLETFAATLDNAMASNKSYQQMKAKLTSAGSGTAEIDQFSTMLEANMFADMGIDKSALTAFSAYMKQRGNIASLRSDYAGRSASSIDVSAGVLADTDSEKLNRASQAATEARQQAMEPVTRVIGDLSAVLSDYAAAYPNITSAIVGATDAVMVFAATAAAFGGVKMLTGALGKGGAGLARGIGGSVAAQGARSMASGASVAAMAPAVGGAVSGAARNVLGGVTKAAPLISVAAGAYEGYNILTSDASTEDKGIAATRLAASTAGSAGGAWAGGLAGAAMGSVVPVIGTAVGGIVGSIVGAIGGGAIMDSVGEWLGKSWFGSDDDEDKDDIAAQSEQPIPVPDANELSPAELQEAVRLMQEPREVKLDVNVVVDVENGNLTAAINEVNAREARRH